MTKRRLTRALALLLATVCLSLSVPDARASSSKTLEFGSRGTAVLKLQQALSTLGYDPSGMDGKFGRGTEAAVVAYQASRGLIADGKAGSLTQAAIYAELAALSGAAVSASSAEASASGGAQSASGTLELGSEGSAVKELQMALTALGYNPNGVDGSFGKGTRAAVRAFQSANGLKADGKAGSLTLSKLYSLTTGGGASAESTSTTTSTTTSTQTSSGGFTRTLRRGMSGTDVTLVQSRLSALGYYQGSIDGSYGRASIAAVTAFQSANGLTADGLAGAATFAKLFADGAIPSAAASASAAASSTPSSTDASSGAASSAASSSTSGYPLLSLNMSGGDVTAMQQALVNLGYSLSVSGTFDSTTKSAVQSFQRANGLSADGVAGTLTLTKLYGGSAVTAASAAAVAADSSSGTYHITDGTGSASGPSTSSVQLLHWFNDVKPSIRAGQTITIFDPATGLQWQLRLYSLGRHADSEPRTLQDTQIMFKAFGYANDWTPKPVYVQLPSGTWTLAAMHNVPHLTGSISDNGFDGHLCVHFLRDMDECQQNDPNYGVTNQKDHPLQMVPDDGADRELTELSTDAARSRR